MKKSGAMCLNNMIRKAITNDKQPQNIERLSREGLDYMMEEIYERELSLLTFETLADVYKVDFELELNVQYNDQNITKILNRENIIWFELDDIYKTLTGKELESANKCYRELCNKFNVINGSLCLK